VRCPKLQEINFTTGVKQEDATRPYVTVSEDIEGKNSPFRKA
jgi:phage FluMu protein Com